MRGEAGAEAHADRATTKRARHIQILSEAVLEQDIAEFTETQFVAFISDRGIRFDNFGNLIVTLSIPKEMFDEAIKLRSAMINTTPLSIDIQRWRVDE